MFSGDFGTKSCDLAQNSLLFQYSCIYGNEEGSCAQAEGAETELLKYVCGPAEAKMKSENF